MQYCLQRGATFTNLCRESCTQTRVNVNVASDWLMSV